MAEMFVSAAISTVTAKASDFLLKDFTTALGLGVEHNRHKLCSLLLIMQSVVADAEECSRADPVVRIWLHELMYVVYQAEDVLDELKYDAISKTAETETRSEKKSTPFSPSLSRPESSFSSGDKLKGVLEKIEAVVAIWGPQQQSMTVVNRPTSLTNDYATDSTVIGRSDDLERLVAIVLGLAEVDQQDIVAALPIVGMAGLDKTTIEGKIGHSGAGLDGADPISGRFTQIVQISANFGRSGPFQSNFGRNAN